MNTSARTCLHCGAQIGPDAKFCEVCGHKIVWNEAAEAAQPAISADPFALPPAQQPSQPYRQDSGAPVATQPGPAPKRKLSTPWIIGGCGCLGILCLGLIVGGSILSSQGTLKTILSMLTPTPQVVVVVPADLPTEMPTSTLAAIDTATVPPDATAAPSATSEPTLAPTTPPEATATLEALPSATTPPQTGDPQWSASIGQSLQDTYFTEDFSTEKFEWANVDDEIRSFSVEDSHYAIHLKQPEYTVWAYLPVDYNPTTIEFDAAVVEGQDIGAYGVLCFYQDVDNYHQISIDPLNKEYSIGYLVDDEYISLLPDIWMPTTNLNESPYAVNDILLVCDQDMITLFINDEYEAQVEISAPAGDAMAIYIETWDEMAETGFKTLFDNLFAFIPVQ